MVLFELILLKVLLNYLLEVHLWNIISLVLDFSCLICFHRTSRTSRTIISLVVAFLALELVVFMFLLYLDWTLSHFVISFSFCSYCCLILTFGVGWGWPRAILSGVILGCFQPM